MRTIRNEIRTLPGEVTIPQFRILVFLKIHPRSSLSSAAEHIGLTLPSMSNSVDGLVKRGLVAREPSAEDRRRITLALTSAGSRIVDEAWQAAQGKIAEAFSQLEPDELSTIQRSMSLLRDIFTSQQRS